MSKSRRESQSARRASKLRQVVPASADRNALVSRGARQPARRKAHPQPVTDLTEIVQRAIRGAQEGATADIGILDELRRHGFSRDEILDLVGQRGVLARKKDSRRLSTAQSDRAVRLARITVMAERVFGDDAKAHGWLRDPSPMLRGWTPLKLLKSETGAQLVEQALHRIDYGMFA